MMKALVEYEDGRQHTYEARQKLKTVRIFVDDKIKLTIDRNGEITSNKKPRFEDAR